jgi:quinol monooxygenase YgiN
MGFIQLVEFTTANTDQIRQLGEQFRRDTEGKRTSLRAMICADRDVPDRYVVVAEFPSYEEAMANSELPETQEFAAAMSELVQGPPSYRNLDVIESWEG